MNDFLKFYNEHDISPVKQDISRFSIHLEIRNKLYRQLGIPVGLLKGKNILEVGPGSGYNTLAFFSWVGVGGIDLVEPNMRGRLDMISNFNKHKINKERYFIYEGTVEQFSPLKMYDMVIAENFIPGVPNKEEILNKLKSCVTDNGIIVITCVDEISFFVERMKRLVVQMLVSKIDKFDDKVDLLLDVFDTQFKFLPSMTRDRRDWVQDMLLNPAASTTSLFSLLDAVEQFGDEYDILGSSPQMFLDYSWFKDYKFDYKEEMRTQFQKKNCNLILTGEKEFILKPEQTLEIKLRLGKIEQYASDFEKEFDKKNIERIIFELTEGTELWKLMGEKFVGFCKQTIEILLDINNLHNIIESDLFFSAFGRGTQYISFVKKEKN